MTLHKIMVAPHFQGFSVFSSFTKQLLIYKRPYSLQINHAYCSLSVFSSIPHPRRAGISVSSAHKCCGPSSRVQGLPIHFPRASCACVFSILHSESPHLQLATCHGRDFPSQNRINSTEQPSPPPPERQLLDIDQKSLSSSFRTCICHVVGIR